MSTKIQTSGKIYNLLILGAFEPEIDLLLKYLPDLNASKHVQNNKELQVTLYCTGIGSLESALFLQALLLETNKPDEIIFIGSAGAYFPSANQASFVLANQFSNYDLSVMEDKAKTIQTMNRIIQTQFGYISKQITSRFENATNTIINATNSISLAPPSPHSSFLKGIQKNHLYESLEGFGLAHICKKKQIPFSSLLAITNDVCENGSLQWQKNHKKMSHELQTKLLDFFNITP